MNYNCKTEEHSLNDFRGCQNPLKLFENLRNGDVNLRNKSSKVYIGPRGNKKMK